jgi:hypothetical protein
MPRARNRRWTARFGEFLRICRGKIETIRPKRGNKAGLVPKKYQIMLPEIFSTTDFRGVDPFGTTFHYCAPTQVFTCLDH